MTVARASVERLLRPVLTWLEAGGDAWGMDLEYWRIRRKLMEEGETFEGLGAELLSNIDTAMDSFSPDADRGRHEIDETQLRTELEAAINGLRNMKLIE